MSLFKEMEYEEVLEVAKEWEKAIAERRYADFRVQVSRYHESEIAEVFECISEEYESRAFRLLTKEQAAEVFGAEHRKPEEADAQSQRKAQPVLFLKAEYRFFLNPDLIHRPPPRIPECPRAGSPAPHTA